MVALIAAAVIAVPWTQPVRFRHLAGWTTGTSGTVRTATSADGRVYRLRYAESTAWIANVPYRDPTTADPPARTVHRMPKDGIVVWAVIEPPSGAKNRISLDIGQAGQGLCCDGTPPPYTREWDLVGLGLTGRYEVIVRVYFGSKPNRARQGRAQRALHAIVLPT